MFKSSSISNGDATTTDFPYANQREMGLGRAVVRHRRLLSIAVACVVLLMTVEGRCSTQTWSPGGAGGGNGAWNTSTANWNGNKKWSDGNDAVFSGTGGTVTVASVTANSLTFNGTGPYQLTGGTLWLNNDAVTVNSAATIGSAISVFANLSLSGDGTLTLTGNSSQAYQGIFDFFSDLTLLNINGGGNVTDANASIGETSGSNATVAVSGIGSTWTTTDTLDVGTFATGALQISNGGTVSSEGSVMGYLNNVSGSVTVSGSGSQWATTDLTIGDMGTGTLQITNGGTVSVSGPVILGAMAGSSGTLKVSGSGSKLTQTGNLFLTVGGDSLSDSGVGLLSISNGGTVTSSEMMVGGTGTIAFGKNATVNNSIFVYGGLLEGSGSGSSLAVNSDVTLYAGSTLMLDIDAASNLADELEISNGDFVLSGDDTLTIALLNGSQLTLPSYVLATFPTGGISGQFSTTNLPNGYELDYGTGVPGELRMVAAVPEPGACALLMVAAAALGMLRRHRSRA